MTLITITTARAELRAIAKMARPIALAQVGLVTMGLVDTAILGRVSSIELAGASVGRNIGFTASTLSIGIAMALEPLAAQAVGAREPDRAWGALIATMRTLVAVWLPSTVAAFAATLFLGKLGIDAEVVRAARQFLVAQAPGQHFFSLFLAQKTFLQAHGSTRPALVASGAANLLNFVLCNLLVRGDAALRSVGLPAVGLAELGSFGAGLATSVAALVLTLVLHAAARTFKPADAVARVPARAVLDLGLPAGLHMLAEVGGFALVSVLAAKLGKTAVAANQVALGLASFTFMAALGVSGATAVRVGHCVGAGLSPRRSGLVGIGLGASVMMLGSLSFALFPRPLVALFTSDPAVIDLGVQLLRVAAIFQLFDGVQAVGAGALRGAGDVRFVLFVGVGAYWVVGVPMAVIFGFVMGRGAVGMWWALSIALMTAATAFLARFIAITRRPIARAAAP